MDQARTRAVQVLESNSESARKFVGGGLFPKLCGSKLLLDQLGQQDRVVLVNIECAIHPVQEKLKKNPDTH